MSLHHHPDPELSLEHGETHVHHHLGHGGASHAFVGALVLTFAFAGVEALAGWWSGSLALIADAGHMLTDSASLGLAAVAAWLARRPPTLRHSYGLVRAEILAALVNSVAMLALVGWIAFEAWQRFGTPHEIAGGTVLVVASLGLAVNLGVAWFLSHGDKTLNSRAALLHVMGDLLGSVAAIVAGIVIIATGWTPIDPLLSLVVAALIGVSAVRLLREALHVLMEGVPLQVDLASIAADLTALPGVTHVHDLHVWTLSSGVTALTAHVEIADVTDIPPVMHEARALLTSRYAIRHVTLQPEIAPH